MQGHAGRALKLDRNAKQRQDQAAKLAESGIPVDEAVVQTTGRFSCLICFPRPSFDQLAELVAHREGKKHLRAVETAAERKKERLQNKSIEMQATSALRTSFPSFFPSGEAGNSIVSSKVSSIVSLSSSMIVVKAEKPTTTHDSNDNSNNNFDLVDEDADGDNEDDRPAPKEFFATSDIWTSYWDDWEKRQQAGEIRDDDEDEEDDKNNASSKALMLTKKSEISKQSLVMSSTKKGPIYDFSGGSSSLSSSSTSDLPPRASGESVFEWRKRVRSGVEKALGQAGWVRTEDGKEWKQTTQKPSEETEEDDSTTTFITAAATAAI